MKTKSLTLLLLALALLIACNKNSTDQSSNGSLKETVQLAAPNGAKISNTIADLKNQITTYYLKKNLPAPATINVKSIDYKISPKGKDAFFAVVYYEDQHGILHNMTIVKGGSLKKSGKTNTLTSARMAYDCYYMYCSGGACEIEFYDDGDEYIVGCSGGSGCQVVNGLPPGADPNFPDMGDNPYVTWCL